MTIEEIMDALGQSEYVIFVGDGGSFVSGMQSAQVYNAIRMEQKDARRYRAQSEWRGIMDG